MTYLVVFSGGRSVAIRTASEFGVEASASVVVLSACGCLVVRTAAEGTVLAAASFQLGTCEWMDGWMD